MVYYLEIKSRISSLNIYKMTSRNGLLDLAVYNSITWWDNC